MLQAAEIKPTDRVLEIGAGSGYQTALLAQLAQHVFAVERHPSLVASASATLEHLGYKNITLVAGDGSLGLPEAAPFDAIIVSAAAPWISCCASICVVRLPLASYVYLYSEMSCNAVGGV